MKQKNIYLVSLVIIVITFSSLQQVQGNQVSWEIGDKYTWTVYSGFADYYENETTRWDEAYFFINHRLESKILAIDSVENKVDLEESWYFTPSSDEPFTVQEVDKSYDLIGGLSGKDITNLYVFDYEFDSIENETYLNAIQGNFGGTQFPFRYFCTASWSVTNSFMLALFDNSTILDTVNGTEIIFQEFLDNCTYTIMGESDYTTGINKIVPTNHHWTASFDYSNLLEARGPEIVSFVIEEANATFELCYSKGGVLEKFYSRNEIAIKVNNNYTFHKYNVRDYILIDSTPIRNLLLKIIPATIVGVIVIVIIILVVNTLKKRRV